MSDGLTQYNGADFKYILNYYDQPDLSDFKDLKIWLSDGLVFDNSAVFLTYDTDNNCNYIIKGELNQ